MKVAILGAAHQHVDYALAEVAHRDELELVAASEPDPKLRERFLSGLSAPLYDTPQQLLEAHDVDVALITGIYNQRAEAAVAALRAGAHVLADKPLCTSLTQLETIREAAVDAERHVSIVFEKRFYPATLALRRLLSGGVLGNIAMVAATGPHKLNQPTRPAWFLDPATYGGIAGDLPIHDIDLVLDLIGEQQGTAPVGTVSAHVGNARADDHPGFDDHVALLMLAGDVPATIEANWLGPGGGRRPRSLPHARDRLTRHGRGRLGLSPPDRDHPRPRDLGRAARPRPASRPVLLRRTARRRAAGNHDRCEPAGHRNRPQSAVQRWQGGSATALLSGQA